MTEAEASLRREIVETCLWMNRSGLNQGTSGNVSARCGERLLITPSAVPYEELTPDSLAAMPLAAEGEGWEGPLKPSSEWRFHRDILRGRPDVGAVLHTHATYATTLAICGRGIPAVHYMIAAFGGPDIRCAPYATFGTAELSAHALAALEGRNGCLLANHGMIAVGPSLRKTRWLAEELETLAKQYILSLQIGGPVVLSDEAIAETAAKFAGYGL